MNAQIVEAGHHQDRYREGETGHANLGCVPSAREGQGENHCTGKVVQTVIWVGKAGVGVGLVGLEAELMKLGLLLGCQGSLQIIHFYIINNYQYKA